MTADLTRLDGLRYRAGQTQNTLDAWELEHGCSPRDPKLIVQHNELLLENIESQRWLDIATAQLDGRMNFTPKKLSSEQTKTTKRKTTATN